MLHAAGSGPRKFLPDGVGARKNVAQEKTLGLLVTVAARNGACQDALLREEKSGRKQSLPLILVFGLSATVRGLPHCRRAERDRQCRFPRARGNAESLPLASVGREGKQVFHPHPQAAVPHITCKVGSLRRAANSALVVRPLSFNSRIVAPTWASTFQDTGAFLRKIAPPDCCSCPPPSKPRFSPRNTGRIAQLYGTCSGSGDTRGQIHLVKHPGWSHSEFVHRVSI